MSRNSPGRAQSPADKLSEREFLLAAMLAALFVICAMSFSRLVYGRFPAKTIFNYRRYYLLLMFATIVPLLPGLIVGGGIGELITYLGGHHELAVYWTSTLVGAAFNWYFYFVLFSGIIRRRNKRKLATAEGTI